MATNESSISTVARLTFGAGDEPENLQALGANLIEIARINNAIRLIDPKSPSYSPSRLIGSQYYSNRLYKYINEEDRLYVTRANKESPLWLEVGVLTSATGAFGVGLWLAIIKTLDRRDQHRWRREDTRMRIVEYFLKRVEHKNDWEISQAAEKIERSLEILEEADNPLIAVDNLLSAPQQRDNAERIFQELTSKRNINH